MALTLLPEEVLEQIVQHFNVKDILACTCVSLEWREKFNVDAFWKRFCLKEIKDYLELTDCEVEPRFFLPKQNEEQLQPLCNWRIHYMRIVHLINNWKKAKYSCCKFRAYTGVLSSEVKVDGEGIHWLFIRTKAEIEIWNINNVPCLHTSVPIFANCPNINIFIAGKRAVITQWNITSVYELKFLPEPCVAVNRFLIEEIKSLPTSLWGTSNKADIHLINEDDDFRFSNFGNLIVGYKRLPNFKTDLCMHIWDVNIGEKLKIESMLNSLSDTYDISFMNIFKIDEFTGLIRLVYCSLENVLVSQLYVYDFKRQHFTDLNIEIVGVVVWCGCAHNIVITFSPHPGTINFYNYSSGKLLSVKEVGEYTNSEQMQLINSNLLYCMFNCMNVLDIHKQEVVYCLEFSFYSFVRRLTVIDPRFVVVWLLERGASPGCPSYYQEIWDMKDLSSNIFQYSSDLGFEMVTSSSSMIKQVIGYNSMMYVYNFW